MWRTYPVTLGLESMYTTSAGTNTFETGLADAKTHPVVDVARFKGGPNATRTVYDDKRRRRSGDD